MKRIAILSIAVISLAGLLSFSVPLTAHAEPKAQSEASAKKCRTKYHNKSYEDGGATLQKLLKDSPCFIDSGNCQANGTTQTARMVKVECTKKPGTNAVARQEAKAESEAATEAATSEYAQDPALSSKFSCTKTRCDIIANYINPTITLLTVLVGIAVVIGIIWGAIQVMTSAGDPQKSASGKNHIRNALIGAVGYLMLWALLQFIIPGGFN